MNDINCIGFKSSWCHHNTDMYTILFKYSISITSTLYQKYIYLTSSLFQILVVFFPILNSISNQSFQGNISLYIY